MVYTQSVHYIRKAQLMSHELLSSITGPRVPLTITSCVLILGLIACDDEGNPNEPVGGSLVAGLAPTAAVMAGARSGAEAGLFGGEPLGGGEPGGAEEAAGAVAGASGEEAGGGVMGGADSPELDVEPPPEPYPAPAYAVYIEPTEQRDGDPALGYDHFINSPFVGCGFPTSIFDQIDVERFFPLVGLPSESAYLEGRTGANAELPYFLTHNVTDSGVEVAGLNCMNCHASALNGSLVVGLGNTTLKTVNDPGVFARSMVSLYQDPAEREAASYWAERMSAVGEAVVLDTRGVVAADNMAVVLFGRRDPQTMEWREDYQVELPEGGLDPVPLAVPPLWRMGKKNAMFYSASFRGDHTRFMFSASSLCVSGLDELLEIDSYFHHVRAWITELEPPRWPGELDEARVQRGEERFMELCSRCHGSYEKTRTRRDLDRYPNLIIPIDEVNTDPMLLAFESSFVEVFSDWVAASPLGQSNWLEDSPGYVAPPLDGIWSTAPYLHNDSVPTLWDLLKSQDRPAYWRRLSARSDDLDEQRVGWAYTVEDQGRAEGAPPEIYDATRLGYLNTGHSYGDALNDEERLDLIEYLKTL